MEENKGGQAIPEIKKTKVCSRCKKAQDPEKDFYGKTAVCKTCTKARVKDNREKRKALEGAGQESPKSELMTMPTTLSEIDAEQERLKQRMVLLDFSEYPEIVETIEAEAKSDIRTLEQQMLWILRNWIESRE